MLVSLGHSSVYHSITVRVKSRLIHPNYFDKYVKYRQGLKTYDIALLELSEALKFNKEIQPIALPDEDFNETNYLDKSRSKFMVAGWGVTFNIPNAIFPYHISNSTFTAFHFTCNMSLGTSYKLHFSCSISNLDMGFQVFGCTLPPKLS